MTVSLKRSERESFRHLSVKLKTLGVSDTEVDAVLSRIKVRTGVVAPSGEVEACGGSPGRSTVVMEGIACLYQRLADGARHILAFQYPGDFCDLNRHLLPGAVSDVGIGAITHCSVGTISHGDLDQLIAQHPLLGRALWRASMLEAVILRKNLVNVVRQPALQRVAHLLCEHLVRREAVGMNTAVVALSQLDLADATGLSIVHVNRTFRELRELKLVCKEGRRMKVLDRKRLACLAAFDGDYLNLPQRLSHWQVDIEPPPPIPFLRRQSGNQ
jgi:CRP-like cAMP-binding protein